MLSSVQFKYHCFGNDFTKIKCVKLGVRYFKQTGYHYTPLDSQLFSLNQSVVNLVKEIC